MLWKLTFSLSPSASAETLSSAASFSSSRSSRSWSASCPEEEPSSSGGSVCAPDSDVSAFFGALQAEETRSKLRYSLEQKKASWNVWNCAQKKHNQEFQKSVNNIFFQISRKVQHTVHWTVWIDSIKPLNRSRNKPTCWAKGQITISVSWNDVHLHTLRYMAE